MSKKSCIPTIAVSTTIVATVALFRAMVTPRTTRSLADFYLELALERFMNEWLSHGIYAAKIMWRKQGLRETPVIVAYAEDIKRDIELLPTIDIRTGLEVVLIQSDRMFESLQPYPRTSGPSKRDFLDA